MDSEHPGKELFMQRGHKLRLVFPLTSCEYNIIDYTFLRQVHLDCLPFPSESLEKIWILVIITTLLQFSVNKG